MKVTEIKAARNIRAAASTTPQHRRIVELRFTNAGSISAVESCRLDSIRWLERYCLGAGDEARTRNFQLGKLTLYH
jgi:hypothetical protein